MDSNNIDIKIDLNTKDLKEVALRVLDKFCDGISWTLTHSTPKRLAIDGYIEDIKNSNLDPQTKAVLLFNAKRDIKRWANTHTICEKAIGKLQKTTHVEDVEEDWADLFRECSGTISLEGLQEIWAIILTQECNEPGSIPKALLNTLMSMGKREADDFSNLVSFCVKIGDTMHPLIVFSKIDTYYSSHGLDLDKLLRLDTLGLINLDMNALGGIGISVDRDAEIRYFDKSIRRSELSDEDKEGLSIGAVTLSFIGEALMKIMVPREIEGFFDDVAVPYLKNPGQFVEDMFGHIGEILE